MRDLLRRVPITTLAGALAYFAGLYPTRTFASSPSLSPSSSRSDLDVAEALDDFNSFQSAEEPLSDAAKSSVLNANSAAESGEFQEAGEFLDEATFFVFKEAIFNFPLQSRAIDFFKRGLLKEEHYEDLLTQKRLFFENLRKVNSPALARAKGLRFITIAFLWEQVLATLESKAQFTETNAPLTPFDLALDMLFSHLRKLTYPANFSKLFNNGDQRPYLLASKQASSLLSESLKLLRDRNQRFIDQLKTHRSNALANNQPDRDILDALTNSAHNDPTFNPFQTTTLETFHLAESYFEKNCEDCRKEDLSLFRDLVRAYSTDLSKSDSPKKAEQIRLLIEKISSPETASKGSARVISNFAPDRVVLKNVDALLYLKSQAASVRKEYLRRASTYQKLFVQDREQSLKALDLLETTIHSTINKVKFNSDIDFNILFADRWKPHYVALIKTILDAVMSHSHQSLSYAEVLYETMNRLSVQETNFFTASSLKRIRALNENFKSDEIFRAWVNTDNIALGALSTLLAAEAVLALPSFGTSLAAMPYTSAAIAAISLSARTVMIANSAFRINDRYTFSGAGGLLNVDTAVDALIILTMLPRMPILAKPTPPASLPMQGSIAARSFAAMKNLWSYSQYFLRTIPARASQHLMQAQYAGGSLLTLTAGTYGSYQALYAESIAAGLQREGVNISPSEIRWNGIRNLLTSLISFTANRNFLQRNFKESPITTGKFIIDRRFSNSFLANRLRGAVNPLRAATNFYAKSQLSAPIKAIGSSLVLSAYALYDYVIVSESLLFSYTNLDSRYMNKSLESDPLPELRPGESTLGLVGFDQEDFILYFGSHAKHSHRWELQKFGAGYTIDDFSSPDEFILKIKQYAAKNGPIRYLKIMTHGKPGVLYTSSAVSGDAVGVDSGGIAADPADLGWINSEWLEKYGEKIKSVARESFAPDARIVLFACLVGSNLDYLEKDELPKPGEGVNAYEDKLHVGDRFLQQLGDKLLVNGGLINASTRILAGLDVSYGSALKALATNGQKIDFERKLIPLIDLERPLEIENSPRHIESQEDLLTSSRIHAPSERFFFLTHENENDESVSIAEFDSSPDVWDRLHYIGDRAKSLLPAIPKLIAKYGVQLEGPWWESRYKKLEVKPH